MKVYRVEDSKTPYYCGYWNGAGIEIAEASFREPREIEDFHYHKEQTEYYFTISGQAILEVVKDGANKCMLLKPGRIVVVEPGETHKVRRICNPELYGDFHHVMIKSPSKKDDKIIV